MDKKILMIIASGNFRDEEYEIPKNVFIKNGFQVTTASSKTTPCTGMLGALVTPDVLYTEIDPADFDAVIFVGGGGAREYFDDESAHEIAKKTLAANRLLGAICIAPSILANAGLMHGKKAAVFGSQQGNLAEKGALLQKSDVVKDGDIVTAKGPESAQRFAKIIVDALQ